VPATCHSGFSLPVCAARGVALAALVIAALGATPVLAGPYGAAGDAYVTSDASNLLRQYDGTSGAYSGVFTPSTAASGQMAVHFGATNNRVLIGHLSGGVEEYNATTGAYIKTYNPGGGWQWAGLYAPNGNVLIGDMSTGDVRQYDSTTGAFISVLTTVPDPADMRFGPNGHLYICSFSGGYVKEVVFPAGTPAGFWPIPGGTQVNDIAFHPTTGEILITVMGLNKVFRFDVAHNFLGMFGNAGWGNTHGIDVNPATGNIFVVDGATGQVYVYDPVTFTELTPSFLNPTPGDKVVDLEFKRHSGATPTGSRTWGAIKHLYR
jgi:hypothetical protein